MTGMAYINGEFMAPEDAKISVFDLGFTRSDVVYDVVSTWKGQFFRLDDHVRRFLASAAGIRIDCPLDGETIKSILAECVGRGGLQDAYVSLSVTRGRFRDPANRDLAETEPTFIAYAIPFVWVISPELQETGIDLFVASTHRIPDSAVVQQHKNYHWGDLTRGWWQARDAGYHNAILCAPDGSLAEGPGFNVFFLADGMLKTPSNNVLHGITRKSVFELAEEMEIPVAEGNFNADDLRAADEIFLTTTAGGIMPVRKIDNHVLSNGVPGPVSRKLREEFWRKREAGWHGTSVASLRVT